MKKLKKLSAIVAAAGILGFTAPGLAAEQKFNIPEYSLEGAEEKTTYQIITLYGNFEVNDPAEAEGYPVVTMKRYGIDRNKDGKTDMVYIEMIIPDMESANPFTGEKIKEDGYTAKQLYIDDNFDGYIERALIDQVDADGKKGADGIYEQEQHAPRIEDLMK